MQVLIIQVCQVLKLLPVHETRYRQAVGTETVCSKRSKGKSKLELEVNNSRNAHRTSRKNLSHYYYCSTLRLRNMHIWWEVIFCQGILIFHFFRLQTRQFIPRKEAWASYRQVNPRQRKSCLWLRATRRTSQTRFEKSSLPCHRI